MIKILPCIFIISKFKSRAFKLHSTKLPSMADFFIGRIIMNYNELLEIYKNPETENCENSGTDPAVKRIMSPKPLKDLQELTEISSLRFRYTGPGKWVKIIREAK